MGYAEKHDIRFVVLAGENEMNEGSYTLKDMKDGGAGEGFFGWVSF